MVAPATESFSIVMLGWLCWIDCLLIGVGDSYRRQ